jgi:two-component system C4-dicarboxylate transport sensor histidine kinase DctB
MQERLTTSGVLATGLIHEFKNLIAHIRLCAEFGLVRSDGPSKDRGLKAVLDNSEMGMKSVGTLLEVFSPSEPGEPAPVKLGENLSLLFKIIQASYRFEKIQFQLSIEEDCTIRVPRGELEQALLNLLRNSIEALKKAVGIKKKKVSLRISGSEADVVMELTDNAGGVPLEVQAVLFDAPAAGDPKGLGLYLANEVIKRNGGNLEYIPLSGGSCFRIVFPRESQPGT